MLKEIRAFQITSKNEIFAIVLYKDNSKYILLAHMMLGPIEEYIDTRTEATTRFDELVEMLIDESFK